MSQRLVLYAPHHCPLPLTLPSPSRFVHHPLVPGAHFITQLQQAGLARTLMTAICRLDGCSPGIGSGRCGRWLLLLLMMMMMMT